MLFQAKLHRGAGAVLGPIEELTEQLLRNLLPMYPE